MVYRPPSIAITAGEDAAREPLAGAPIALKRVAGPAGVCARGPPVKQGSYGGAVVIHEGAGRVKGGQGPRVVVRPECCDGRGAGGGVPVIHSAAPGGPECRAVLEGSIKWSAASRTV